MQQSGQGGAFVGGFVQPDDRDDLGERPAFGEGRCRIRSLLR